jgi:very-short-patch-repair endonuclease
MEPLVAVGKRMSVQGGVISRAQAIELGLSQRNIGHEVETGRWLLMSKGVYATAGAKPSWERQLWAALLSHPGSLVAGRSAGYLHEFSGIRRSRPEILMPFQGNARSASARVIRSRHFESVTSVVIDGLPVTSPAETVLTLSLREHPGTIERVVDDALANRKLLMSDFDPILERLENARQPGLPSLRRIVGERREDAYQPPTSELERLLYRLLDKPRIPSHTRQLPIEYPRMRATVDAFIPAWDMIVEGDGRRWHTRKEDFERDRRRDNAAAAAGLVVVRFTYWMLKDDPEGCHATLTEAGRWRETA